MIIDVNGINSAYGITGLAVVSFVLYYFKWLCQTGWSATGAIGKAGIHTTKIHASMVKIVWEARIELTGISLCLMLFVALCYIGNYHLRGENFGLVSFWTIAPAVVLMVSLVGGIGSLYIESVHHNRKKGMTSEQAAFYDKCLACSNRSVGMERRAARCMGCSSRYGCRYDESR